ncbi:UNVERIFIED_CONTAM: hypothetical protein PYX00_009501 [Menopon gallinae]|uniref:Uncharacterized protein n=1 Tax=Menopon gallinae TaxID=328185 RepID=A0AAW2HBG3_9NEOP
MGKLLPDRRRTASATTATGTIPYINLIQSRRIQDGYIRQRTSTVKTVEDAADYNAEGPGPQPCYTERLPAEQYHHSFVTRKHCETNFRFRSYRTGCCRTTTVLGPAVGSIAWDAVSILPTRRKPPPTRCRWSSTENSPFCRNTAAAATATADQTPLKLQIIKIADEIHDTKHTIHQNSTFFLI